MKATTSFRPARPAAKPAASAAALSIIVAMLSACSTEVQPPAPTPAPTPAPVATAPPVAPQPIVREPVFENYLDAPQTAGTWRYLNEPGETLAMFGVDIRQPVFAVRCSAGNIELGRMIANGSSTTRVMKVTTETTSRQFQAEPRSGNFPAAVVRLEPRDPLLDAMAITKGRFAVGVEGERTLYLPAWAEVTRVIEDCR